MNCSQRDEGRKDEDVVTVSSSSKEEAGRESRLTEFQT